jgi:hypothetical protein
MVMTKINDGGPAFPKADDRDPITGQGIREGCDGMSLRDWFAGQALIGMISSAPIVDRTAVDKPGWARVAFAFADAMLAAREKPEAV